MLQNGGLHLGLTRVKQETNDEELRSQRRRNSGPCLSASPAPNPEFPLHGETGRPAHSPPGASMAFSSVLSPPIFSRLLGRIPEGWTTRKDLQFVQNQSGGQATLKLLKSEWSWLSLKELLWTMCTSCFLVKNLLLITGSITTQVSSPASEGKETALAAGCLFLRIQ